MNAPRFKVDVSRIFRLGLLLADFEFNFMEIVLPFLLLGHFPGKNRTEPFEQNRLSLLPEL